MQHTATTLPDIPAKRYFTIGEVSELCGVKPYVLRYWEQEFTQLRPMKRRGNRRYYQHHEVLLIRRIRDLLYDQGFTISGARNRLTEGGNEPAAAALPVAPDIDLDPELVALERLSAGLMAANDLPVMARAALDSQAVAEMRVRPALPSNPNPAQVREELLAIRDLLSI
jgi:DNA-binding transcriptional MerR regulator